VNEVAYAALQPFNASNKGRTTTRIVKPGNARVRIAITVSLQVQAEKRRQAVRATSQAGSHALRPF
jgi:hypothetical protein